MNQIRYQRRPADSGTIPNVIFFLLVANGLLFALQQFPPYYLEYFFSLWPIEAVRGSFYPWQIVTYGFLHGSVGHVVFNMLMLWMFGREIEILMGPRRFITYYLTCVVGAGLVQLLVAYLQNGQYNTVGASGGVFGILLAFGMAFPNRMVMLLIPPIPMKAKYLVILAGVFELYLGVSGRAPGVANFAHLGGMLFGFLLIQHWRRPRRPH
ncbi:MAG: rhomboid family intramembrane serine protease [Gammaproteobacteria bacterium]|nr:rhomboid family intramembrane serine protease [Gammaproteobacteria bacterium]MDH4313625.1 rhomboid family intramembrane serine protease [Gammaproteobacteria bacterium]MDH5213324.1 rhomboid family intramembrane serine protease [Gammaproteobacteria bacterium]MDH5500497.1 rhomboid family intramembrane serine protease [Gammaproteobacteria bacterium]